jgi:hypothetical protein
MPIELTTLPSVVKASVLAKRLRNLSIASSYGGDGQATMWSQIVEEACGFSKAQNHLIN